MLQNFNPYTAKLFAVLTPQDAKYFLNILFINTQIMSETVDFFDYSMIMLN